MNLIIKHKEYDFLEPIQQQNFILVMNQHTLFEFYYYFYQLLILKKKEIEIRIGEKTIDAKNTILFSFCDYNEILNALEFKKGTLLYEYMISLLYENENLDKDVLFYDLASVIQNMISLSHLKLDNELEEDIEKILFNFSEFHLKYSIKELSSILNELLKKYLLRNINKTVIIFYNSSLLSLDVSFIDSYYSFDLSEEYEIEKYNLICEDKIHKFDLDSLVDRLENIWPVEFKKEKIKEYVTKYFTYLKYHSKLEVGNEQEYLTYILLNKILNKNVEILQNNFVIRANIKSFLEQI